MLQGAQGLGLGLAPLGATTMPAIARVEYDTISDIADDAATRPSGFTAWSAGLSADLGAQLALRKAPMSVSEATGLIVSAPTGGDISASFGLRPMGEIMAESDAVAAGSLTRIRGAASRLEGGPGTAREKMQTFAREIVGSIKEIGDSELALGEDIDNLNRMVVGITDAVQANPALAAKARGILERLQARIDKIEDELQKRAAMRAFLMQLLGGNPSKATVDKLRAMGLGSWVDEVTRTILKFMRRFGGIPAGLIAALQAAGMGGLVESDARGLAVDRARGRENDAIKNAELRHEILALTPGAAATSQQVAAGQALVGAGQLSRPGIQPTIPVGTAPVGTSGPVTGGGDPNQKFTAD